MYQRILVPVDGSSTAEHALNEAIKFTQHQHAEVELVHVLEDVGYVDEENFLNYVELRDSMKSSGERILAQAQQKLNQAGLNVRCTLLEAHGERTANVISTAAKNLSADLIIIGTHGRTGFNRMLMGSVGEGVVRTAHIPILLIRGSAIDR